MSLVPLSGAMSSLAAEERAISWTIVRESCNSWFGLLMRRRNRKKIVTAQMRYVDVIMSVDV